MSEPAANDLLSLSVGQIAGIGPKSAAALAALGVATLGELIEQILPNKYYDYRQILPVATLPQHEGETVTVRGTLRRLSTRRVRRYVITSAELVDATGAVKVTWFNQPYLEREIVAGQPVLLHGRFGFYRDAFGLTAPKLIDERTLAERGSYLAAYPPINRQLTANTIGKLMHGLRGLFGRFAELMPSFAAYGVWPHFKALYALHFGEDAAQVRAGQRRMSFERLFIMYLAGLLDARELAQLQSIAMPYDEARLAQLVKMLPFKLTDDQKRAVIMGARDLAAAHPTNRLLQGDVGSGKTAVAFVLAAYVAQVGFQVVLLAPTSVLAAQHYANFIKLFGELKVTARLVTGASKGKKRLKQELADGTAQVVIGTTALLAERVQFKHLALAVVDEQQRFGVGQRTALMQGDCLPHLLSMTATPIPRSLFLAQHGSQLAVSSLRAKPAGRAPITTRALVPLQIKQVHQAIRETLARGEQVYYVCPKITAEQHGAASPTLEREFKELERLFGGQIGVEFLHGGLAAELKEERMWRFQEGKTGILVATSLIEVGLDNPRATLMVIRDADSFGLSQLHQLRGRVGRGALPSQCLLVASDDEKIPARLLEVVQSEDGFRLAELDLERRKIGRRVEVETGMAQHGRNELLTPDDLALIQAAPEFAAKARAAAAEFAAAFEQELPRYPMLAARLAAYRQDKTVID